MARKSALIRAVAPGGRQVRGHGPRSVKRLLSQRLLVVAKIAQEARIFIHHENVLAEGRIRRARRAKLGRTE